MKRLTARLCGIALLLGSCGAPAQVPAPRTATPTAPAPRAAVSAPARHIHAVPALWMVKDADTIVYLFGTVHVLRPDIDWFEGPVKRAYDSAGDLVLEMVAPDDATSAKLVMALAVDPDGPPLTQKLDPGLRARYSAAMTQAGLPVSQFEPLEPWFVASVLGIVPLQKLGYSAESGAEAVLTKAAKASGKPLLGLETIQQQLGFFDTLPEPLQIRFLDSTIKELPKMNSMFGQLIDSWSRGDADRLGSLMNEGLRETPELAKILLADRNARWSQWVQARMARPGISFVAVGAGHLAGADSVQAMLAKRGVKAVRVQ